MTRPPSRPSRSGRPPRSTCTSASAASATTASTRSTPSTRRSRSTTTSRVGAGADELSSVIARRRLHRPRGRARRATTTSSRCARCAAAHRGRTADRRAARASTSRRRWHGRRLGRRRRRPGRARPAARPAHQPDDVLLALAAGLGSDVPFSLVGGTARGVGRGELVTPVDDAGSWWWVAVPSTEGLSTPTVYRHFDALRPDAPDVAGLRPSPARGAGDAGSRCASPAHCTTTSRSRRSTCAPSSASSSRWGSRRVRSAASSAAPARPRLPLRLRRGRARDRCRTGGRRARRGAHGDRSGGRGPPRHGARHLAESRGFAPDGMNPAAPGKHPAMVCATSVPNG